MAWNSLSLSSQHLTTPKSSLASYSPPTMAAERLNLPPVPWLQRWRRQLSCGVAAAATAWWHLRQRGSIGSGGGGGSATVRWWWRQGWQLVGGRNTVAAAFVAKY